MPGGCQFSALEGGSGISAPKGLEKLVDWVCSEIRPGGVFSLNSSFSIDSLAMHALAFVLGLEARCAC